MQPHFFLVKEHQELLQNSTQTVSIEHCFRETDQVANRLANLRVTLTSSLVVFEVPPYSVKHLLANYARGVSCHVSYMIDNT